ncbi:hypothetical protein AVEN_39344-1 [Araneus ventricosus]|uniref:Uncharacterized protein n=1 Tax=Araneus ventricosus TaxID=182803 RepID=A0A4Y2SBE6_ARAVE|nr:hypothetical protein AVEN_59632-1 [Araneus ventricosus]GBN84590.1 hypothetical protein AVEN_39344-1 [Araneus ventricosus]
MRLACLVEIPNDHVEEAKVLFFMGYLKWAHLRQSWPSNRQGKEFKDLLKSERERFIKIKISVLEVGFFDDDKTFSFRAANFTGI